MLISNVNQYTAPKKYLNLRMQTTPHGLSVLVAKYSKKAFYDQAWNEHPDLMQARGHVFVAKSGNIITRPFDKVFNLGENGAGSQLKDDSKVTFVRKVNGFFCAVTRLPKTHTLLVQSSGSVDRTNRFVEMATVMTLVVRDVSCEKFIDGVTLMFEVVHPCDPHIIPEETGIYLIGGRDVESGLPWNEKYLDWISDQMVGVRRHKSEQTTFGALKKKISKSKARGRDDILRRVDITHL